MEKGKYYWAKFVDNNWMPILYFDEKNIRIIGSSNKVNKKDFDAFGEEIKMNDEKENYVSASLNIIVRDILDSLNDDIVELTKKLKASLDRLDSLDRNI